MASDASRTLVCAASSDSRAASTTQCATWSSSRPRLTACRALVMALTWVRMSMQ